MRVCRVPASAWLDCRAFAVALHSPSEYMRKILDMYVRRFDLTFQPHRFSVPQILVANNGIGAVKAIRSMRRWVSPRDLTCSIHRSLVQCFFFSIGYHVSPEVAGRIKGLQVKFPMFFITSVAFIARKITKSSVPAGLNTSLAMFVRRREGLEPLLCWTSFEYLTLKK